MWSVKFLRLSVNQESRKQNGSSGSQVDLDVALAAQLAHDARCQEEALTRNFIQPTTNFGKVLSFCLGYYRFRETDELTFWFFVGSLKFPF